jgi:tyrosine decarboxylase/aspartate 1-decarboxylase
VDAAFGGFVIPFLKDMGYDIPDFDFSVPNVFSMSVDPHKMGLSTIPSGALLIRRGEHLEKIAVDSPYLTTMRHTALSGTRASAAVAATWSVMKHLGRDGYREGVKGCMDNTMYLKQRVEELGLSLVREPVMNILGVNLKDPRKVDRTLQGRGWRVSKGSHPCCLRFIVMPHVTAEVIDEFIPVLKQVCEETGEL